MTLVLTVVVNDAGKQPYETITRYHDQIVGAISNIRGVESVQSAAWRNRDDMLAYLDRRQSIEAAAAHMTNALTMIAQLRRIETG